MYSSPFTRALETIAPFCAAIGVTPVVREDLGESTAEELLPQVRQRMVAAVTDIAASHGGETVLVCTHGGTMWGLLSHYDSSFGYNHYRQIKCPDIRRLMYTDGEGGIDPGFSLG